MATPSDGPSVGRLVYRLLFELLAEKYEHRDPGAFAATAVRLLEQQRIWAWLARTGDGLPVGVLTVHECAAVYAGGHFGEISELFVEAEHRGAGLGERLVDKARQHASDRGWPHIEVGAPQLPRWQRTVDFYTRLGFKTVGPRLSLVI